MLGDSSKFAFGAQKLQIDIDEVEIGKNVQVDHAILGDLKVALSRINDKLENQYHKEWMDKVMARKEALPMTYNPEGLTGPYVVERFSEILGGDASIRCGLRSIINTKSPDIFSHPVVWVPWDTVSEPVSEQR